MTHGSLFSGIGGFDLAAEVCGSSRCSLTWRLRGTKFNRSYFLLQVSARGTKDTGHGLLPTVRANEWGEYQNDRGDKTKPRLTLSGLAKNGLLPTPTVNDAGNSCLPPSQIERDSLVGVLLRAGKTGLLNPAFVEEMMGFPIGWTELEGLETP